MFLPCEKWANRVQLRQKRVVHVRRGVHVGVVARLLENINSPLTQTLLRQGIDVSRLDISPVVCPNCYEARYGSIRFLCLSQACALVELARPIPYAKGRSHDPSVLVTSHSVLPNFIFPCIVPFQRYPQKTNWNNKVDIKRLLTQNSVARHPTSPRWELARPFGGHSVLFPGNKCGPTWEGCTIIRLCAVHKIHTIRYEMSQMPLIQKYLDVVNEICGDEFLKLTWFWMKTVLTVWKMGKPSAGKAKEGDFRTSRSTCGSCFKASWKY